MKTLRYLLEKEFKQIRRDKIIPRMILVMPVLQLIILPFAANFEMKNINLAIVDNDYSTTTQRITEQIVSSGYFQLAGKTVSYAEALPMIENNDADIILEYPAGMEKDLGREGQATVFIAANAVNASKAGIGTSYLSSILQQFNVSTTPNAHIKPTEIKSTNLYNPYLDYKAYMVPGIIAFLMTIVGGFMSALNIVSEKEKGTIEQINVTPLPKAVFILSKLIPFWVIGLVILTLAMIVAWLVYGFVPVGNILIIYSFAALYLFALTGLGLAVSTISATQQQAMFTMFFCNIIFILLGGLFTPITSMPEWAQTFTLFNPLRYFVELMRMVYLNGSILSDLTTHFIAIILFIVTFNVLAIIGYRKQS